jgi:MoxR-like ATPase
MTPSPHQFTFIGHGDLADLTPQLGTIKPWKNNIGGWRPRHGAPEETDNTKEPNHPANYRARGDLADAVNTALALSKPLLLTGNPGTGKSQLAERIAWEFNIGPVLRFEAQSLSEANDLFYRFDLVGHLAAVEMLKSATRRDSQGGLADQLRKEDNPLAAERFVKLGPLGEAIVRSNPKDNEVLFDSVFGPDEVAAKTEGRPCVVLIDEIDKASRDFPNDLLNGIERLEFRIRELGLRTMKVADAYQPIVIITSNSERDLPAPFLRRCTFFHIEDPTKEELRQIVAQRFFSGSAGPDSSGPTLPPFYQRVLDAFWNFRDHHQDVLQYRPGTSELIDWTDALRKDKAETKAGATESTLLGRAASAVAKHKEDQQALKTFLEGLTTSTP